MADKPKDKPEQLAERITENDPNVTAADWEKFDQDLYRYNEDRKYMWYGACFGQTKRILCTTISTACVGYKGNEMVFAANPRFLFDNMTFHQRAFIYSHEIEHIIRSHVSVMEDHPEKSKEYNIIMDSLINEALLDYNGNWSHGDMPDGMIDFDTIKKLIKEAKVLGGKAQHELNAGLTAHEYYKEYATEDVGKFIPRLPPEEGGADPFGDACDRLYGDLGEFFNDGSVPDEVKDAMIEQMIDEAQKSRGLSPAHLAPFIDKIKDKTNRDWRMMMRGLGRSSHIKITRSWVKWNKRNPSLSMPLRPGKYFKSLPSVLVMADTSGSIGERELVHFIREINGLTSKCMIDMAWVDAHFDEHNPQIFHRKIKGTRDFVKRAQFPVGRGGTYFTEFYEYALRNYGMYQHILILTDGYSDYIPSRLVPGQQLALMTPGHSNGFVQAAKDSGFKVAIIEDIV